MPPTPANQKAGELHEIYLAKVNDGSKSRASGSKWFDQGDGRNAHDLPFAFCWDGKAALAGTKSISVTREMIAKIREQAQGERPQIGLRWYATGDLSKVSEDWIAVPAADWEEILQAARKLAALESDFGDLDAFLRLPAIILPVGDDLSQEETERFREDLGDLIRRGGVSGFAQLLRSPSEQGGDGPDEMTTLREELSVVREALEDANSAVRARDEELERYKTGRVIPPFVPRLPWAVVFQAHLPGEVKTTGMRYAADGTMTAIDVSEIRVERSMSNRPRLIVNNGLVTNGDLYVDGILRARAWQDNSADEVG